MPGRSRALSFFTTWSSSGSAPPSPTQRDSSPQQQQQQQQQPPPPLTLEAPGKKSHRISSSNDFNVYNPATNSVPSSPQTGRPRSGSEPPKSNSRRNSLMNYQAPVMEVDQDIPPELQRILSYLNGHTNKLYQEGYFLKLHDLDSRGRPSADRIWNECFAQLVGTVLSLWDAAQLDAAGDDGEVIPTFINLTDASIKMIESLPMNGIDGQALQNVLSVSTAANNRYLFHFNSLHSLTQWTAGIRLAMYEQATLQEAYTGSILAGKGRHLNGIKSIMERSRFPTEDWVRVRFGAGTPWRRCWCIITPPDEKQFQKAQKDAKKKSAYERSAPVVKGDIKFYDTRKVTKKSTPIATVTDAFAAYALYPQSKNLIDQSTLIKVEGIITIHTSPETTTEGFVFVMPEAHPAISGFEIMLRWLIPTYDTFALYGRPTRLVADVIDTRSLMFAMPPAPSRYGYLELIDVAGLIHGEGSTSWNEREWRKQMKLLTSKRMTSGPGSTNRSESDTSSRTPASRSSLNLQTGASKSSLNLPPTRAGVKFGDQVNGRSAPGSRQGSPAHEGGFGPPPRTETAPPASGAPFSSPHKRVASDRIYNRPMEPSRLSFETHRDDDNPPPPPPHGNPENGRTTGQGRSFDYDRGAGGRPQEYGPSEPHQNGYAAQPPPMEHVPNNKLAPYNPVAAPPAMAHKGGQRPPVRPNQMPDLRRANSAIDAATLAQIADTNRVQRATSSSGARDDASMSMQQPPSGAAVMAPMGNPNYSPDPGAYSRAPPQSGHPPMQMRMGPPPSGPPNQRGPPPPSHSSQGTGPSRLATIPGTPAFEQNNFDLPPQHQPNQVNRPGQGQGTFKRKPIPERQDSYGFGRGQPPPRY